MILKAWLLVTLSIGFVRGCADVLFVVDTSNSKNIKNAIETAQGLDSQILLSTIIENTGFHERIGMQNKNDAILLLQHVKGEFELMLDAVTYEIAGLRNHESLIILIFTDRKISKNFTEIWHENKASDKIYAFRVGSKESKDMAQNELFLRLTKCKADKEGSKTREQDAINALRNLNVQNTQDLIQTTTLRANIQNTQTAAQSTSKPSTVSTEFITISSSRLTTPTRDPFATTSRTTREMTSTPNPSILDSIITTPMIPTVPTASLHVFTKKSTKSTPPHPTLVRFTKDRIITTLSPPQSPNSLSNSRIPRRFITTERPSVASKIKQLDIDGAAVELSHIRSKENSLIQSTDDNERRPRTHERIKLFQPTTQIPIQSTERILTRPTESPTKKTTFRRFVQTIVKHSNNLIEESVDQAFTRRPSLSTLNLVVHATIKPAAQSSTSTSVDSDQPISRTPFRFIQRPIAQNNLESTSTSKPIKVIFAHSTIKPSHETSTRRFIEKPEKKLTLENVDDVELGFPAKRPAKTISTSQIKMSPLRNQIVQTKTAEKPEVKPTIRPHTVHEVIKPSTPSATSRSLLRQTTLPPIQSTTKLFEKPRKLSTSQDIKSGAVSGRILFQPTAQTPIISTTANSHIFTLTKRTTTPRPLTSTRIFQTTTASPAKKSTTPVNIFKKFKMFNPELALNGVSTLKPTFTRSSSFQRQSQTIKAGVLLNSQASSKKPFVRGSSSDCNLDVIFLVDFSQGTGDKSPRYLEIAASAVDQMPLEERGVRVGLMKYSAHADVLVKLKDGQNKDDVIKEMLKSRQAGGTTKSGEAINVAAKQFTERGRRKTLILFTDGYSQDDVSLAAMEAKRSGIRIVVVTVEDDRIPADSVQLKMIASSPDALLASPKGSELRNLIINPFCRN